MIFTATVFHRNSSDRSQEASGERAMLMLLRGVDLELVLLAFQVEGFLVKGLGWWRKSR